MAVVAVTKVRKSEKDSPPGRCSPSERVSQLGKPRDLPVDWYGMVFHCSLGREHLQCVSICVRRGENKGTCMYLLAVFG